MRLIDADDLYQEAENRSEKMNGYFNELSRVITAWDINHAPTIDAVQVVRCKDCEHWETVVERKRAKNGMCARHESLCITKYDAFCSQGERKKQQGDGTLCEEGHW